jgi:hypothetical protein
LNNVRFLLYAQAADACKANGILDIFRYIKREGLLLAHHRKLRCKESRRRDLSRRPREQFADTLDTLAGALVTLPN